MINKANILVIDNPQILEKLNLEDIIKKYTGILIFRDPSITLNLGLITEPEEEVIYDKYGNKEGLTKEKLENILKDA